MNRNVFTCRDKVKYETNLVVEYTFYLWLAHPIMMMFGVFGCRFFVFFLGGEGDFFYIHFSIALSPTHMAMTLLKRVLKVFLTVIVTFSFHLKIN